jgi:hypothetical protein
VKLPAELAEDLAGVEHHRKALARALGVPEHAQLAAQLTRRRVNCAKALFTPMNWWFCAITLLRLAVEHAEVLDVVEQPLGHQQAQYRALHAQALLGNCLAVQGFLLVVHAQPGEEVFPVRREAAHLGLDAVGEQAHALATNSCGISAL